MLFRRFLLIFGVVALLVGLSLVVVWLVGSGRSSQAPQVAQTVIHKVLVAARPLPSGTLLRAEDMGWEQMPEPLPPDVITAENGAPATFVGFAVRRPFLANEPILAARLIKPGDRDFLVATLASDKRAIALTLSPDSGTTTFVRAGDHVDVVLTQSFQGTETSVDRRSVSETVLRDLRVIAVDQWSDLQPKPGSNPVGPDIRQPRAVTLEVTQTQAEILLTAVQLGKVELALRGLDRSEAANAVVPTWASDVSPALRDLGRPRRARQSAPISVEVTRGTKTERRCLRDDGLLHSDCATP